MGAAERNDGIFYRGVGYEPLPSQVAFHASDARIKGFSGPIGSGKSAALCHEAIKLAYANSGRSGLIGAPTYLQATRWARFISPLSFHRINSTQ